MFRCLFLCPFGSTLHYLTFVKTEKSSRTFNIILKYTSLIYNLKIVLLCLHFLQGHLQNFNLSSSIVLKKVMLTKMKIKMNVDYLPTCGL